MKPVPTITDVESRFAATDELLDLISEELKEGRAARDLLDSLRLLWENVPAGTTLTTAEQSRLAAVMQKLGDTVAAGEAWMQQASVTLDHMARGHRMQKVYHA